MVGVHGTGLLDVGANGYVGVNTGTLSVAGGSQIALAGGYIAASTATVSQGALVAGAGSFGVNSLTNNGEIRAMGFLVVGGDISGTGTLEIGTGGTLLLNTVFSQGAIDFIGTHATLQVGQFPSIHAPLADFLPTDRILAAYVDSVSFNAQTDQLTLYSGGSAEGTLTFTGDLSGYTFHDTYGSNSVGTITITPKH